MKTLISLVLLASSLSFASPYGNTGKVKLLDCNVSGGFQQIVVTQDDGKFTLSTLDSSGYWNDYKLTAKQWDSKKINIPCSRYKGTCGQVYQSQGDWAYSMGEYGFYVHGFCQ